jgi:hypothetical protein
MEVMSTRGFCCVGLEVLLHWRLRCLFYLRVFVCLGVVYLHSIMLYCDASTQIEINCWFSCFWYIHFISLQ